MNKKKLVLGVLLASSILVFTGCKSNVTDKPLTMHFGSQVREVTYTGEVENDVPNGKGTIKGTNSAGTNWVYEGEVKDGKMDGKGKTTWATGLAQEGTYKDNYIVEGKITSNGKVLYEGKINHGIPDKPMTPIGQFTSYADWDYKVDSKTNVNTIGNDAAQQSFLILRMSIKNNGSTPRQFADAQGKFILFDDKGRQFGQDDEAMLAARLIGGYSSNWYLDKFNPGATGEVVLIFDVPKDATGLKLLPVKGVYKADAIDVGTAQ